MSMNVSLTAELEKFVEDKVKSGLYSSASEVVRESLRLMRRQDELEKLKFDELRKEIQAGIKQLDSGMGIPLSDARAKIRQKRAEFKKKDS